MTNKSNTIPPALHTETEARQLAALLHLAVLPFHTVVSEVQLCNQEDPALGANRVYLPDQLSALCTTDAAEIGDVPRCWFALTVDPSVANPDYLAAALNTPLGTIIRESLQSPHMRRLQPETFAATPPLSIFPRLFYNVLPPRSPLRPKSTKSSLVDSSNRDLV